MTALGHDLKLAARYLRKAWLFAGLSIVILAIGIGANATLFSLADSVMFRPFPLAEQERLVIAGENQMAGRSEVSYLNFKDWRGRSRAFDGLAAMGSSDWDITLGGAEPVPVAHRAVTGNFFDVLGVGAAAGRTFSEADDVPGAARVVVIGHGLWQRRFGGDPAVVGRSLVLDEAPFTVVGVMPRGFTYPPGTEAWSPLVPLLAAIRPPAPDFFQNRDAAMLHVVGRLRIGASVETARADLDRVIRELSSEFGRREQAASRLTLLVDDLLAASRPGLWALFAAVVLLLAVASANVAGLMLVQSSRRRREFAVRMALGASRPAIGRQLLCETLILVGFAIVAGLLLANVALPLVLALVPQTIPRLDEAAIDARVVMFTALAGAASAMLCWGAPVLTLDRGALDVTLRTAGRAFASGGFSRPARRLLVTLEIAVAIVILTLAGLLYRSVVQLERLDLGFRPAGLIAVELEQPFDLTAATTEGANRFYERAADAVRTLSAVESVGAAGGRPLKGAIGLDSSWRIEGQSDEEADRNPWVNFETVSPSYFDTMRTLLISGRLFNDDDRDTTQPVVIVSDKLARWAWPGESAIGKRVGAAALEGWWTVVGVVADIRYRRLEEARLDMYVSHRQSPFAAGDLVVRTRERVGLLAPLIRERLRPLNPQGVVRIMAMEEAVAAHQAPWRANLTLFGLFASLTVLLAVIGLYALVSSTVVEETREIGVRLALGATTGRIVRLVLLHGGRTALVGVGLGVPASFAAARLIRSLLFEVSPLDGFALAAAPIALVAVSLVACALPARRAARVDPVISLRAE
jgi:putative ABC transport system permease protein